MGGGAKEKKKRKEKEKEKEKRVSDGEQEGQPPQVEDTGKKG